MRVPGVRQGKGAGGEGEKMMDWHDFCVFVIGIAAGVLGGNLAALTLVLFWDWTAKRREKKASGGQRWGNS